MANPQKGEVELKAGDETYILCYSIDAICSLEDSMDKGLPVIAEEMMQPRKMRISSVRQILRAGLLERHPDITLKQAGELIVAAGGAIAVLEKISAAFVAAFPEGEASEKKRPRRGASVPTGPAS